MFIPVALTIAGSDCSAGAGLQADLKTLSSLGVHGLTAVSCVVSETPLTVRQVHPVPPVILQDQVNLLLASYPVSAIKTGMLYSKAHIVAICEILADQNIPHIVDPVMVASTGDPLLEEDALSAISDRLLPLASVITPNIPEAELLLGSTIRSQEDQKNAAGELSKKFNCACYLKGGHANELGEHRDVLVQADHFETFTAPHLEIPQTHGTGCTLSAALAGGIASGLSVPEACKKAHQFTHQALINSTSWSSPRSGEKIFHLQQNQ